jgi:hypothetical protein
VMDDRLELEPDFGEFVKAENDYAAEKKIP